MQNTCGHSQIKAYCSLKCEVTAAKARRVKRLAKGISDHEAATREIARNDAFIKRIAVAR